METIRSFCRVCTSVCGILVDVDGDQVVQVHGDKDHPFSKGYTCAKGRALPQLHHHPDRLRRHAAGTLESNRRKSTAGSIVRVP
jgi:anaerobic selenocysteine-containing dehydrogenase